MLRILLILTVVVGSASPAAAQIYSWRDADGRLVLSSTARPDKGEQTTYEVHGASAIKATTAPISTLRSAQYDAAINEHAQRQGVAADLVRAVIQAESAFNPVAVSNKGAMGLMQLMPSTAHDLGVSNPFDPNENIRGGVTYLKQLLNRYDQKVELALAAYNAGSGNVDKYGAVPPFKETRSYVAKITKAAPPVPVSIIYKWMELVNGQPKARYSNKPPASGSYEIVGRQ